MDVVKAGMGLIGTVVIAGWVAYAVSAPRNVDNAFDQEMSALDGKTINEVMAESKEEAYRMQCEQARRHADEAWDRAIERGEQPDTADIDRQVERFCQ